MMRKIIVLSLDFDGCLFHNRGYIGSKTMHPVIDENPIIIKEILSTIHAGQYHEAIFMVGSNRQSRDVDVLNATRGGKGSCFVAIHKFCDEIKKQHGGINFRVDPYLLADTYGNRLAGENFNKALTRDPNFKFNTWLFDETKLTILYAQMHKISSENPDAEITYQFFDDRHYDNGDPDDILCGLNDFFLNNHDLMPKNLTLRLHHYNGADYANIANIKGTGQIDFNYQKNLILMTHHAGLDHHNDHKKQNDVKKLLCRNNGDKLIQFKEERVTSKNSLPTDDHHTPPLSPKQRQ